MANIDKIIKSKYQPKQTNVAWIDLSGEKPVEKHFINGGWVEIGGSDIDISGKADKEVTPTIITPSVDGTIQNMTNNEIASLRIGDIVLNAGWMNYTVFKKSGDSNGSEILLSYVDSENIIVISLKKANGVWAYKRFWSIPLTNINTIPSKANKILVVDELPQSGMLPNTLYNIGELIADTTFVMAAATDNTIANIWTWTFSTSSTAPTITWPAEITMWSDGEAPTIEANKYYEVSVMNGVGTVISADIPQTEVEP